MNFDREPVKETPRGTRRAGALAGEEEWFPAGWCMSKFISTFGQREFRSSSSQVSQRDR
jgi:hypothetical protein